MKKCGLSQLPSSVRAVPRGKQMHNISRRLRRSLAANVQRSTSTVGWLFVPEYVRRYSPRRLASWTSSCPSLSASLNFAGDLRRPEDGPEQASPVQPTARRPPHHARWLAPFQSFNCQRTARQSRTRTSHTFSHVRTQYAATGTHIQPFTARSPPPLFACIRRTARVPVSPMPSYGRWIAGPSPADPLYISSCGLAVSGCVAVAEW